MPRPRQELEQIEAVALSSDGDEGVMTAACAHASAERNSGPPPAKKRRFPKKCDVITLSDSDNDDETAASLALTILINEHAAIKLANKAMSQNDREGPTRDECPICLTLEIADPSIPGGCGNNPGHKFCFVCLRTWYKNNPSCPLCGVSSTFIRHRLSQNGGAGIIEPITELKREFLKEKIKDESERVPLDVEKQLLHKYYRYLNSRLNMNDQEMESDKIKLQRRQDQETFKEREKNRQKLVQAINVVKSLEEACGNGSITRLELNKNPYFRGMIYDHHLKREDIFENEQRRNFSPQMAREELDADLHQLRNWLREEIPIFLNRPVGQIEDFERKIEDVLKARPQRYIHGPEFENACRLIFLESGKRFETFCNEFFDFALSQYSVDQFLRNSRYRSGEASQNATRGRQEVIQIDDYVPIDNDVQIVDGGQPNRSTEYSNYLAGQQNIMADGPSTLPSTSRITRPPLLPRPFDPKLATQRVGSFSEFGRAVPTEEIVLSSDDEGRQRANEILARRDDSQMQGSSRSSYGDCPVTPTNQIKKRKLKK